MNFNEECKKEVEEKLKIEKHLIDFRSEQFGFYHQAMLSMIYDCISLKNVYDTNSFIRGYLGIENTLGNLLNNQQAHVTFNGVIQMSSIFEYCRKEYEQTISGRGYYKRMKEKYSHLAESVELLNDFRNTIHSNGKWNYPSNKNRPDKLIYNLREGKQEIKNGEPLKYDNWFLYRLIKKGMELHKKLALSNEAMKIRKVRGSKNLVAIKLDFDINDVINNKVENDK
jgi:hypothetical protein